MGSMDRSFKIKQIIKHFKNIGASTAPMILDAGIETLEHLEKIGAEEAYFKMWQLHPEMEIHAMYLWALEGAIQRKNLLALDQKRKEELSNYAQAMRDSLK